MSWGGPYEEGVSQSLLNKFLECPYRFYIYAILGLEEKRPFEPNLIWGDTEHKGLELLIEKPGLSRDFSQEEWQAIDDEMDKHLQQYSPYPPSFPFSVKEMLRLYSDEYKLDNLPFETERKFKIPYSTGRNQLFLRGKLDGVNEHTIVEHKCKGKLTPEQMRDEVPEDLQINMYILAYQHFFETDNIPGIIYDNIRIPDTQFYIPERRQRQTVKNWVEDLYHTRDSGDFPVKKKRGLWLDQAFIPIEREQHERFKKFTLNPLLDLICAWWKHVNRKGFDFEDPDCYNEVFYRVPVRHFNPSNTENYKCNYHGFLTGNLSLSELSPVKSYFPELEVVKSGEPN